MNQGIMFFTLFGIVIGLIISFLHYQSIKDSDDVSNSLVFPFWLIGFSMIGYAFDMTFGLVPM